MGNTVSIPRFVAAGVPTLASASGAAPADAPRDPVPTDGGAAPGPASAAFADEQTFVALNVAAYGGRREARTAMAKPGWRILGEHRLAEAMRGLGGAWVVDRAVSDRLPEEVLFVLRAKLVEPVR
jgi:hypothetical protein